MNRTHSSTPLRGRAALVLSSVLALLALACFPVGAQAEGSGEMEYNPTLPSPDGKKHPGSEKIAETSNDHAPGGGVTAPPATPESGQPGGSPGGAPMSEDGGGRKAVGKGSGPSQGSPGGGHQDGGNAQATTGAPASSEGGGGSSPLVPILIAAVILAAISVGVVVVRQRRRPSAGASPLSPKAG
jgi:hypothetical protein